MRPLYVVVHEASLSLAKIGAVHGAEDAITELGKLRDSGAKMVSVRGDPSEIPAEVFSHLEEDPEAEVRVCGSLLGGSLDYFGGVEACVDKQLISMMASERIPSGQVCVYEPATLLSPKHPNYQG